MGAVWGKKKAAPGAKQHAQWSEKDKAVLELKRQRDRLKKYRQELERVLEREKEVARSLLASGQKRKALLALRKKKYQEQLVYRTEGQLLNVEEMMGRVEEAAVQQQVLSALKSGKEALERINSEMRIEDVEKLMEDTAEAIRYQDQVSEMLGASLSKEDAVSVDAELAELEAAQALEEASALPSVPARPAEVRQEEKEPEEVHPEAQARGEERKLEEPLAA